MSIKIAREGLKALLDVTTRVQHINNKAQPQVSSCIVKSDGKEASTTSVVKDGKTSLGKFSFKVIEGSGQIPVPDIDRMLGALKYHNDIVTLSVVDDKVKIKSKGKQTTLLGTDNAKAFPNSQKTLKEWSKMSVDRAKQVGKAQYTMQDGQSRTAFFSATVPADTLHDALRCDGMNGQKLNRYNFCMKDGKLTVTVGDHFKGKTDSELGEFVHDEFEATFEGGLENVVKHYSDDVKLHFLDFTKEGQGIRLIIEFSNGDWVFQAGVL